MHEKAQRAEIFVTKTISYTIQNPVRGGRSSKNVTPHGVHWLCYNIIYQNNYIPLGLLWSALDDT